MRFVLANCVYFCFLFYYSIVDLQCCVNHFYSAKWFSYTYMWWFSSLSHAHLFATPWTEPSQASQSVGFSRQDYWSGLPFPSPGDLPDSGIKPRSPALQADSLPTKLSVLSIFSCAFWPSVCLLQRNVYLDPLPIFWLGCFFDIEVCELFGYFGD